MAEAAFETTWQKIVTQLKPGMSIQNWTYLKGYPGDEMKVHKVSREIIVIDAPRAKLLQSIPKADFQAVWEIWPKYTSGQAQRQIFTDITRYSKYIISILKWVEQI
jgi:hypothetical protein